MNSKSPHTSNSVEHEPNQSVNAVAHSNENEMTEEAQPTHKPWIMLPVVLFIATCFSSYFAWWVWHSIRFSWLTKEPEYWTDGILYASGLLGILFVHEMGHFLQALRYRVPVSLPYFIPMPFFAIGTMGAIIGMRGNEANRKELFDIGISGPIAGLVIALPLAYIGLSQYEPVQADPSIFGSFLLWDWLIYLIHGKLEAGYTVPLSPLAAAGWVGLFLTGLNMMPISQLDGGHVIYALLGKRSFWVARGCLMVGVAYVVLSGETAWVLAIVLLFLMGPTHPPTADDDVPLSPVRYVLGFLTLLLPIICFTPIPFNPLYLH